MTAKLVLAICTAFAAGILLKGCGERGPNTVEVPTVRTRAVTAQESAKLIDLVHFEGQREIAPGQMITALRFDDPLVPNSRAAGSACYVIDHLDSRTVHVVCKGMSVSTGGGF